MNEGPNYSTSFTILVINHGIFKRTLERLTDTTSSHILPSDLYCVPFLSFLFIKLVPAYFQEAKQKKKKKRTVYTAI